MLDIKVASMEMKPQKPGSSCLVVGTFAVNIGPLRISDCAIIRHEDGTLAAAIPRSRAGGKLVKFRDHDDYKNFVEVALTAYRAFAVDEPETVEPRVVDEGVEDAMGLAGLD